jgi:hypothetical protein
MDESTKRLILELKAKSDNMQRLAHELKDLARECSDKIDEEVRR